MPDIQIRPKQVPPIVPDHAPRGLSRGLSGSRAAMSDDECLDRLAQAVAQHDSGHLDEVARLIGRLAITIE